MSVSRRKFLRAGTLVAITAGFPMKTIFAEALSAPDAKALPGLSGQDAAVRLNRETFARHLNSMFSLRHNDSKARVKLIEVTDSTPEAAKPFAKTTGRECFSARFLGSAEVQLRQETYSVEHDSLGKFDLLLVPVGKNRHGFQYEAVFNRLF